MARPAFCGTGRGSLFFRGAGKASLEWRLQNGEHNSVDLYLYLYLRLEWECRPPNGETGRQGTGGRPPRRGKKVPVTHSPLARRTSEQTWRRSQVIFLRALGLGHLGLILVKIGPYVGILQKLVSTWFRDPQKSQNWPQPCVGNLQNQKQKRK